MLRNETVMVKIGNLELGGNEKVYIQSMTNTKTKDILGTIKQIKELEQAGCDIVRVAVKDMSDAKAIKEIKAEIHIPLVADIHFDYRLAIEAILNGADKIRLNPGNIESKEKVLEVVNLCKERKIPIRIGVNSGSLPKDLEKTKEGMIEAAKRHIQILEECDFHDIVLSFKSSDIKLTYETYMLASQTFNYPLHVGLTEAGSLYSGNIKSSMAIGSILLQGIGNTIRVSLSASPVEEVRAAKEILKYLGLIKNEVLVTACPTCGRTEYQMFDLLNKVEEYVKDIHKDIKIAIMGCIVNGPGEASDKDIAICGGRNKLLLYKQGKLYKEIKEENALDELKHLIDEF